MAFSSIFARLFNKVGNEKANQTGDERYRDVYNAEGLNAVNDIRNLEAETRKLKREADLNQEVANQYTEKGRRASMFAENNGEISNTGNRGMLSGATGFARLRRRVLGTPDELVNDKKLGG